MKKFISLFITLSMLVTLSYASFAAEVTDGTVRTIDFDTYSLSHKQTWAGFKNNDNTYNDSIVSAITENGKEGKALELTYKAATWYSGEVFMAVPKEWAIGKSSDYLEFNAKGRGKIKISLETGEVVNGTRYGYTVKIDSSDSWQDIRIPITDFVKNGTSVPLADVVGITFTAAESGNLNNNDAATKAMTKEELEQKAVSGTVIIDNLTLAEAAENPTGRSYTADFESTETKFASGSTWGGFKNTANDYQDYIKAKWLQSGGYNETVGFNVYYRSATYYAGEIFVPAPPVWTENGAEGANYLSFDYKGKGAVKISFSTGNKNGVALTSGTRYTRRFELDSRGGWAKICVPLSEFVNGGNSVDMTQIGAVTFQAAENANLNNNSSDTKAMTKEQLESVARTGDITFDNMVLSETEGETTSFDPIVVTAEVNGVKINKLTNGVITVKVRAIGIEKATKLSAAVAVYDKNGVLEAIKTTDGTVNAGEELTADITVADAENKTMRIFVFGDLATLDPIMNMTQL